MQQALPAQGNSDSHDVVPASNDHPSADEEKAFFTQQTKLSDISTGAKEAIGFEGIEQIDLDTDLWFKLRGDSLNPLIDAATPLFGLILRVRDVQQYADVQQLYNRVHSDIAAIDEEVRTLDYDNSIQVAFRYCLCAFVDEAVMSTSWGVQSVWAERSMLSLYHQETWGGEKFFTIVSRLMMESQNYQDMLEFLYFCLVLGFKGKYGVMQDGTQQLDALIGKLHRLLREQRGSKTEHLIDTKGNVCNKQYRLGQQIPLWSIWAGLAVALGVIYVFYAMNLSGVTEDVLKQLDLILQQ